MLSIFDEPPTLHLWATALGWSAEEVERAAGQLSDATFVTKRVDSKTGQATYQALPITLAFARNELGKMGDLEFTARTRYQKHVQEMELVAAETQRFTSLFARYDVQRETEKKAIILARKAESSAVNFDYDEAERLYQMALQEDPRSVYVLVNYGMLKFNEGQVGEATRLLEEAAQRCTKRTGFLVHFNLGRVYDSVRDRERAAQALRRALEYQPTHVVARHQYGVVLSRLGKTDDAIGVFDALISGELARSTGPTETLLYAYRGKIITLRKAQRSVEAEETRAEAHSVVATWPWLAEKAKDLDSAWVDHENEG